MNKELKGLRMIITFVDRGQGEKVTKLYEKLGAANHQIFLGYGTASSEIYAYNSLKNCSFCSAKV